MFNCDEGNKVKKLLDYVLALKGNSGNLLVMVAKSDGELNPQKQ